MSRQPDWISILSANINPDNKLTRRELYPYRSQKSPQVITQIPGGKQPRSVNGGIHIVLQQISQKLRWS